MKGKNWKEDNYKELNKKKEKGKILLQIRSLLFWDLDGLNNLKNQQGFDSE